MIVTQRLEALMFFRLIYDDTLAQAAYLIGCQKTGDAILIDPERDIDRYLALAEAQGLRISAVTETHIHADYLSGTREVAEQTNARVYLSDEGGPDWTYKWLGERGDGTGAYDHQLLHDGDQFRVGNIRFDVLHTPGHTPEHIAFLVTDEGGGSTEPIGLISGDFVFVGDVGRPDLLETAAGQAGMKEASATAMAQSARRFVELPEFIQVWPAHGAGSACGKALGAVPQSTIGYEKRFNPALQRVGNESSFVDYILAGQPEPPLYFGRMKTENRDGPALLGELPEVLSLKADQLAAVDGRSMGVIDLRPWDEFRENHISGSIWTKLGPSLPSVAGSYLQSHEDIFLICEEEQIEECVRGLVRIGLDRVVAWASRETLAAAAAKFPGNFTTSKEVDVREASQMKDDADTIVLDVRRAVEHQEESIAGSLNVAHTRLCDRLDEIPKDRKLLVHCQGGVRSAFATAVLERHGFDPINVAGGMNAWHAADLPTVSPDAEAVTS